MKVLSFNIVLVNILGHLLNKEDHRVNHTHSLLLSAITNAYILNTMKARNIAISFSTL